MFDGTIWYHFMQRLFLILWLGFIGLVSSLNADEPQRIIDAINATSEAREILLKALQEADSSNDRDQYSGCPTKEQFDKVLEAEKRYNAAARRWFKEMSH